MRNFFIFLLFVAAFFASCAVNRSFKTEQYPNRTPQKKQNYPGVDSTVVREALDYANRLLVDSSQLDKADSLFQRAFISFEIADTLLQMQENIQSDSIFMAICNQWRKQVGLTGKNYNSFLKFDNRRKLDYILSITNQDASQSKFINPFSLNTRGLLVQINMKQGELSGNTEYYLTAVDEIENLLLVDKSNPDVYTRLAECYYALEDWEKCYQNFKEAEAVLHVVSNFKMIEEPGSRALVDTTKWVYLLRGQGEARAKLYDAEGAINCLTKAQNLTRSEVVKNELEKYLSWIDWDEGNIQASELRDEVLLVEEKGDYRKAKQLYLKLMKLLKTQKTKNEINWKIASIDYKHLNKEHEAVNRLFRVMKNINKDEENLPSNLIYRKDYAAMCFSIGINYYQKNEMRLAYIYLRQAAKIEWEHRAKCYLQLALLSQSNPEETVQNCIAALNEKKQLSDEEIKNIHQMLFNAHKQNGEFDKAQYFFSLLATEN